MNRYAAALALAVAAPVAALAQGENPSLDDRFFKAYYQENGLRDFEKAAALYADLAEAARAAKDAAMEAKALLGRARCLKVSGKKDEAQGTLKALLAVQVNHAEAKAMLVALEGAPAEGEDRDLDRRCQQLLESLAGGDVSARREFSLLGARGLPYLEKALRYRSLYYVEQAAYLLSTGTIPGGREALLRALADPEVVYSRAVCEVVMNSQDVANGALSRLPVVDDLPVFEAVARRSEVELRIRVVARMADVDLGADPRARSILAALAADPSLEVRTAVLGHGWQASYWKVVAPAVVAALKSSTPEERAAAARAIKQDPDLLRTEAGVLRSLLKDPDASARRAAVETLSEVDGLGQSDLVALLSDADGSLVTAACEQLRAVSPWEKGVSAAVLEALRRAVRAEVPATGIESVLGFLSADPAPGGLSAEDLASLFVLSWSPEQRLGTRAATEVRERILDAIYNRITSAEGARRIVLRGLGEIRSPDGTLQWMVRWTQEWSYGSVEIGTAAALSGDPRLRAAGYRCLANLRPQAESRDVTPALKRLSEDLMGEDPDLQQAAMSVATVYPDPVSVEAIRKHHATARGGLRASLLMTLVRAAGKEAESEVREDLASKDPEVRAGALAALFRGLDSKDFEEIRKYLASGGSPREVAGLWIDRGGNGPPLEFLRTFLAELAIQGVDASVLRAAALLPAGERNGYLATVLQHPQPHMRIQAAGLVATWRAMECVKPLSALLDDPEANVQTAAAKALEQLNEYLARKTVAARLLDGPPVDPLDAAKALLRSPEPEKRRGAILAMGALQDKAAIPLLLKAIEDPDPTVKAAALAVLERLGTPLK